MAFGGFSDKRQTMPMADINVTPMVDVMLVLLVIFMMAAPLFTHAVRLDLPGAASAPAPAQPETINLSIDGQGKLYWNNDPVEQAALDTRFADASKKSPPPALHLRADKSTRYETIAQVMAAAQSKGLTRIGFVTEPNNTAIRAPSP
jgi:biopolymer transport protein ExbD